MLHFAYDSGALGIFDAARQTFSMNILFFYDEKITYEQMHLLEHLVLHPKRKLEASGPSLHELLAGSPHINALAAGNFLAFKLRCHIEDADYLTNILLELVSKPLNISQETINKEIEVIKNENATTTHPLIPILEKYTHNPFRVEGELKNITPNIIEDWFLYNIKNNKPLILISGDTHQEEVGNAINRTNTRLLEQPKKPTNHEIFFDMDLPSGMKTDFEKGTKEVTLFSSQPHESTLDYFYHTFLFFLLEDLLFDHFRIEEGTDYSPFGLYRNTLYSQEIVYTFDTNLDSNELNNIIKNFFNKGKDYFELKKKKIAGNARLWEDQLTEYYQIAQIYFFTKTFKRTRFIAEQVQAIQYEDFIKYYKRRLQYLSIYANPLTDKNE